MQEKEQQTILIGNSFPLSLIRRKVVIEVVSREAVLEFVQGKAVVSFWGHANTLSAANGWLGVDLTPKTERPALCLSDDKLPQLDGVEYKTCFILSPDYRPGLRPAIGSEVDSVDILGWQVLKISWN